MINNITHTDKALEYHIVAMQRSLTLLEGRLINYRYLCGDQITIADLSAASELDSSRYIDLNISNFPNVKAWLYRVIDENPIVAEVHEHGRKIAAMLVERQKEEGTLPKINISPSMEYALPKL